MPIKYDIKCFYSILYTHLPDKLWEKENWGSHTGIKIYICKRGCQPHYKIFSQMYFYVIFLYKILRVHETDITCFIIVKNQKYQISNIGFISLKLC